MSGRIDEKVALITGAASGLGWPRAAGAVIITAAVSAPRAPNRRSAAVARVTFFGLAVVAIGTVRLFFVQSSGRRPAPGGGPANSPVSHSAHRLTVISPQLPWLCVRVCESAFLFAASDPAKELLACESVPP